MKILFHLGVLSAFLAMLGCSKGPGGVVVSGRPPQSNDLTDPAVLKYELEWHRRTLVEGYEKHGQKDSRWNTSAKAALEAMAEWRVATNIAGKESAYVQITNQVVTAMRQGCTDPLVRYVYARFALDYDGGDVGTVVAEYTRAADEIQTTQYHPYRRFYANYRALRSSTHARRHHPELNVRRVNYANPASEDLLAAIEDASVPANDACSALEDFMLAWSSSPDLRTQTYLPLEKRFLENWGWFYRAQLIHGRFYIDYAWQGRGGGLASTVTSSGWKEMKERLAIAEKALETAWKLKPADPQAACSMITVELGQGQGRERMELWYQRALSADPFNYDARHAKLYYLTPQWYGSRSEALDFARECARTQGGPVGLKLMVPVAHDLIITAMDAQQREEYWQQPGAWPEMRAVYENFFQQHPDQIGFRHNYARHAWWCKQWEELNRQIPLLGPVNYAFFFGKEEFERMLTEAKANRPQ